jgi:serine/threonine protein kinase
MDFVDGHDAAHLLAERYPAGMPQDLAVAIITAVAAALDYAHKQGLLHRDVKPANIILTHVDDEEEQRILLTDFGIARTVDDVSGLTTTNMTVGTVAYCAPEQLMGEAIDGRADQYSLAATAYHLLTGSALFPHSNPAVVISRHLNTRPPALAHTRPELAALDPVLAAALSKQPDDRFARCSDFARALAEQTNIAGAPAPGAPTTPAPISRRPASTSTPAVTRGTKPAEKQAPDHRRLALGGVVAAIVVVVAAAAVVIWRPWEPRHSDSATPSPPPAPISSSTTAPLPAPPVAAPSVNNPPPPPQGQPVDPASTGPAEGSSCSHAQHNNTTISNSGMIVRCVSGTGGYWWQPDTGEQAEPAIVGQQGWAACLKSFPQAQCVMAAVAVAGGSNPAGPVYPPGTYTVPATMPYGIYGASIDYAIGQFNNGVAANPCTYATYDAAGNIITTGTFNSYSQSPPQAEIDHRTTLFRSSGCTPWAFIKGD